MMLPPFSDLLWPEDQSHHQRHPPESSAHQ
jgi:hypothetical protein